MHQLVYVFGENPIDQISEFLCDNIKLTKRSPQYVLENLLGVKDFGDQSSSFEKFSDAQILKLIRSYLNKHDRPIVVVQDDITQDEYYQYLDMGVGCFITFDLDGNLSIVQTILRENMRTDWFVVGGRWRFYLRQKPGTVQPVSELEIDQYRAALAMDRIYSTIAITGKRPETEVVCDDESYPVEKGRDQLSKKNIDVKGMLARGEKTGKLLVELSKIKKERDLPDFHVFTKNYKDYKASKKDYRELYAIPIPEDDFPDGASFDHYFAILDKIPEETFIRLMSLSEFCPSAYVFNGQWVDVERLFLPTQSVEATVKYVEDMENFLKFFESLPGDTLVTVVDCHH